MTLLSKLVTIRRFLCDAKYTAERERADNLMVDSMVMLQI